MVGLGVQVPIPTVDLAVAMRDMSVLAKFAIRKWMSSTPFVRFTLTPSINARCAGNTAQVGPAARKCPVIAKNPAWHRIPRRKLLWR